MASKNQRKRERREAIRRAKQRKRLGMWVGGIAVIAVAVGAFSLMGSGSGDQVTLAADFELGQLGGESVSLSDYRGQPVAVTFMHSW